MQRVGLLGRRHRVQAAHIERVENVYPIYTLDYLHRLERTMNRLAHIQNLVLLGRTGTFWYNNMDHSIRSGLECADDILASERGGLLPVYRRHDFVGKEWNG
jgi:UDP-galactopyranose mutase